MTEQQELWDARYAESQQIWSGKPNVAFVREVEALTPGTALDLGCGEGADAAWLAGRGWRVTAVDISAVALARARTHAVGVDFQLLDLSTSFPAGTYDLVSVQFLHSHGGLPREEILRNASRAVNPGGVLLIEGHLDFGAYAHEGHAGMHFPTPDEVIADLDLKPGEWEVLVAAAHERSQVGPDGEPTVRQDCTVKLRLIDRSDL